MSETVNLELERFYGDEVGTWGKLLAWHGDEPLLPRSFLTVENPWRGNTPYKSCIPAGVYPLQPGTFRGQYPNLEIRAVPRRTSVEMHRANWPSELLGCIGLGETLSVNELGIWTVHGSRLALEALMEAIGEKPLGFIAIRWASLPA